jgi:transposase-like protein
MRTVLSEKRFHNEAEAYRWVEARIWPNGPVCHHCGETERVGLMGGKSTRIGLYKCYACRKPFTVKMGTIFESSHVPLRSWLQAIYLMVSSKKGVSSNQLHRTLGVTLKTAWFMSHRIREALRAGALDPLGGEGKIVEADETYFGQRENYMPSSQRGDRPFTKKGRSGPANKRAVLALLERGGEVRTFHVDRADKVTVTQIVRENVAHESILHTDESRLYSGSDEHFSGHETVKHSADEWVRAGVTTNRVEGYFSVFKRGMKGVYQHCSEKHLHRYLAEYDFRYNNRVGLGVNDEARADKALLGTVGKRLKYN